MRARLRLSLAALAVLATACSSDGTGPGPDTTTPGPALGWSAVDGSPLSPELDRHDDIFWLPPHAWLVSTRGQIHYSADDGATWDLIAGDPNVFYRAVGFASPTKGWVGNINVTNNPPSGRALYETTDGGHTWQNISSRVQGPAPIGICGIWVEDAQTIFAAGRWNGPAIFVRSFDGGATWTSIDLAPLATGLIDLYFWDRQKGIVVGGRGVGNSYAEQDASRTVILMTRNGGITWEERYVSAATGKWAWKISFPTPDTGYVSTQGPNIDGIVLKTTDGGLTWTELEAKRGEGFSGIGFADARTGWVAADFRVYETRDGGATWKHVVLGTSLNRFRFIDGRGLASGRQVYRFDGIPDS